MKFRLSMASAAVAYSTGARYSNTPIFPARNASRNDAGGYHSTCPDSRTATRLSSPKSCPTKPALYVARRSKSASQARRAPQPGVGEVDRTTPRTACPTKPELYIADRSSRPRKRGALHRQDVGEVGRTTRLVSLPYETVVVCALFFPNRRGERLRCVAGETSEGPRRSIRWYTG